MIQQQRQSLNKFNKEVAQDLKEYTKLFNEDEDDDKEINEDMIMILLKSVQAVMKSDPDNTLRWFLFLQSVKMMTELLSNVS